MTDAGSTAATAASTASGCAGHGGEPHGGREAQLTTSASSARANSTLPPVAKSRASGPPTRRRGRWARPERRGRRRSTTSAGSPRRRAGSRGRASVRRRAGGPPGSRPRRWARRRASRRRGPGSPGPVCTGCSPSATHDAHTGERPAELFGGAAGADGHHPEAVVLAVLAASSRPRALRTTRRPGSRRRGAGASGPSHRLQRAAWPQSAHASSGAYPGRATWNEHRAGRAPRSPASAALAACQAVDGMRAARAHRLRGLLVRGEDDAGRDRAIRGELLEPARPRPAAGPRRSARGRRRRARPRRAPGGRAPRRGRGRTD